MNVNESKKFLFDLLQESTSKYRSESKRLKIWVFIFRISILLLAACSTILLGWNAGDNPGYLVWSRNLALAFGSLSTFIAGVSAFWNIETYWLKQKVLFARIRALHQRCNFMEANGTLSPEEIIKAFDEYRAMMDERIEYWEKLASQTTPNPYIEQTIADKPTPVADIKE